MKNATIRIGLIVALLVLLWVAPAGSGHAASLAWAVTCGVAFAASATLLLGASVQFVVAVVLFATAILPAAILLAVAIPVYGGWGRAAAELAAGAVSLQPLNGLEFAVPTLAAAVATLFTARVVSARRRQFHAGE